MINVSQNLSFLWIFDDLQNFPPNEFRSGLIRLVACEQILESGTKLQSALLPGLFVNAQPLLFRRLSRTPALDVKRVTIMVGRHNGVDVIGMSLGVLFELFGQWRIVGWQTVVRCALKYGEVFGLTGDNRDRLNASGSCADHAYALACEINAFVRPRASVKPLAGK